MNDSKSQENQLLSNHGNTRRLEMLTELQQEMVVLGQRRRQTRLQMRVIALGCIIVFVIGFAWLVNRPTNDLVQTAKSNMPDSHQRTNLDPQFNSSVLNFSMEKDRSDIEQRYVVRDMKPAKTFEAIDNNELLSLLAETGQPSVLGKINGRLTIVPAKLHSKREPF